MSQGAVKGCRLGFSPDTWNSRPGQPPNLSLPAQTVPAAKAHTILLDAGEGGAGRGSEGWGAGPDLDRPLPPCQKDKDAWLQGAGCPEVRPYPSLGLRCPRRETGLRASVPMAGWDLRHPEGTLQPKGRHTRTVWALTNPEVPTIMPHSVSKLSGASPTYTGADFPSMEAVQWCSRPPLR